jgi:hypothetical protein
MRHQIVTLSDLSLDKIFLENFCEDYQSWKKVVAIRNFDSIDKTEGIEIINPGVSQNNRRQHRWVRNFRKGYAFC